MNQNYNSQKKRHLVNKQKEKALMKCETCDFHPIRITNDGNHMKETLNIYISTCKSSHEIIRLTGK